MSDFANIDFNTGDHRQRKALRVALVKIFRKKSFAMFLDEDLGVVFEDEVEDGPFPEQVYELIGGFASRGKLNGLMKALFESTEYKDAPALRDLLVAWSSVSAPMPKASGGRHRAVPVPISSTTPALDNILDGGATRIRPMALLSGIAALRRRVCLLRGHTARATAFLVGPDRLLTAAYVTVPPNPFEAVFDFGIGGTGTERVFTVGAPLVLDTNADDYLKSLDYALLPLSEKVGNQVLEDGTIRGWFDLTNMRERLRDSELVFMLHHPLGGAMALSEGVILPSAEYPGRLAHNCSTVPGSGGAPVVDETLRLVGLHEMGFVNAGDRVPKRNLAVRCDHIERDLKARGIALLAPPDREGKTK